MKELEPKFLTPYLPYSLKVVMEGKKTNVAWMSTKNIAVIRPQGIGEYKKIAWTHAHLNIKPILRPLSDLTKEITIDGVTFMPYNFVSTFSRETIDYLREHGEVFQDHSLTVIPYRDAIKLFEWKFDVFRLIQNGLAIDINDLNQ